MDANYWTFGDLPEELPDDYYTDPASALRCQQAKLQDHFENIPDDDYIPFLHPWFGRGVLASAFGITLICNPKLGLLKCHRSAVTTFEETASNE